MRTHLSRPLLILCGALYLCFGRVAVILAPDPGLSGYGPGAHVQFLDDVTWSHGGPDIMAGRFLLYAALSGPWDRAGVLLVALMNAG